MLPKDQFFYYLKPLIQQLHDVFPECVMTKTLLDLQDVLENDVERVALSWYRVMSNPEVVDAVQRRDPVPLANIDNDWIRKLDLTNKITSDRLTTDSRATLWEYVDTLTEYSRACYDYSLIPADQRAIACATNTVAPAPEPITTSIEIPEDIRPMAGMMVNMFESLITQVNLPPGAQNVMRTLTKNITDDVKDGRMDFVSWMQNATQMANQVPDDELVAMAQQGTVMKNAIIQGLGGIGAQLPDLLHNLDRGLQGEIPDVLRDGLGGQFPPCVGGATFENLLTSLTSVLNPAHPPAADVKNSIP